MQVGTNHIGELLSNCAWTADNLENGGWLKACTEYRRRIDQFDPQILRDLGETKVCNRSDVPVPCGFPLTEKEDVWGI